MREFGAPASLHLLEVLEQSRRFQFYHERGKQNEVLLADPCLTIFAFQVAKKRKVEEHPAGTGSQVAKDREVEERVVSCQCNLCDRPKSLPILPCRYMRPIRAEISGGSIFAWR